jgi:hypothetical protein
MSEAPPDEPILIDDRSRPGFREVFGRLARRSTAIDVALTHIRLGTLDLSERELGAVCRIRLVLAQVSAASLDLEAHAVLHRSPMAANLRRLAAMLAGGTIEVRSAPLGGWSPDFSLFHDHEVALGALIGPHRFDRGTAQDGPVLASLHGAAAAQRLQVRFDEVWARAHDIRPAIAGILARADRGTPSTGAATLSEGGPGYTSVDTPCLPG